MDSFIIIVIIIAIVVVAYSALAVKSRFMYIGSLYL